MGSGGQGVKGLGPVVLGVVQSRGWMSEVIGRGLGTKGVGGQGDRVWRVMGWGCRVGVQWVVGVKGGGSRGEGVDHIYRGYLNVSEK